MFVFIIVLWSFDNVIFYDEQITFAFIILKLFTETKIKISVTVYTFVFHYPGICKSRFENISKLCKSLYYTFAWDK